ncbi:hypothetical protein GPECTOR_167g172 [Gonium pectorale]|uniref:TLDc domain-containing protein n=1 Tax=Gonium pectorale TaxID=33097 RepID=A0A150FXE9_GONPE|nr:hypothetical protein GPECTOR_167g172 [Gonium pectorale]|eukprot:KXZ42291.1 hypothetical protein GPECTOR_167g172 [Gonium pectorale]
MTSSPGRKLLRLVADKEDGSVHLAGVIVAKARLERLGEEASLEFTYRLLDAHGDGVRHEALRAAAASCLRLAGVAATAGVAAEGKGADAASAASSQQAAVPAASAAAAAPVGAEAASSQARPESSRPAPEEAHIEAICRGALAAAGGDDYKAVRMSYDSYRQWCKRCPALHGTLARVMHGYGKLPPGAALLQPAWVWALSCRLPPAQRAEWRLLFSSQRDGKSFNTFFGRVTAQPGPTLLLLRDKAGRTFGGYASRPWARSGSFYGDVSCFLFSLEPALQIFPATGINENYQWCGVGFSQLPSGLGWGGAAGARSAGSGLGGGGGGAAVGGGGHFALYVEPSLDEGMSRPIATYGNSPLASEQVFQIDTLECWLLQRPEEEEEAAARAAAANGGGVLARGAQDAALMELAGFKLHSKGMVAEPLEED